MKLRKISRICLILLSMLCCCLFGCDDEGEYKDLEDYYTFFNGDVYVMDEDCSWDDYDFKDFYNVKTRDNLETVIDLSHYKFITVQFEKAISLDGFAMHFKTEDGIKKIRVEGYYLQNYEDLKDFEGDSTDMFAGKYEYHVIGTDVYYFEVDGKGKVKEKINDGEEKEYSYSKVDALGATKYFQFSDENENTFMIAFNPEQNKFFLYENGSRIPREISYTPPFNYGTKIFEKDAYVKDNGWTDIYIDKFLWDGKEGQRHIAMAEDSYIALRVINNCYDARRFDLPYTKITFTNWIVRNA